MTQNITRFPLTVGGFEKCRF